MKDHMFATSWLLLMASHFGANSDRNACQSTTCWSVWDMASSSSSVCCVPFLAFLAKIIWGVIFWVQMGKTIVITLMLTYQTYVP